MVDQEEETRNSEDPNLADGRRLSLHANPTHRISEECSIGSEERDDVNIFEAEPVPCTPKEKSSFRPEGKQNWSND